MGVAKPRCTKWTFCTGSPTLIVTTSAKDRHSRGTGKCGGGGRWGGGGSRGPLRGSGGDGGIAGRGSRRGELSRLAGDARGHVAEVIEVPAAVCHVRVSNPGDADHARVQCEEVGEVTLVLLR